MDSCWVSTYILVHTTTKYYSYHQLNAHLRLYVAEGHIHDILLKGLKVHLSCNLIHIHRCYNEYAVNV